MTQDNLKTEDSPRLSACLRIDAVCDRFEAAWNTGRFPRIRDFLDQARETERAALLKELIPLEVGLRRKRGEKPTAEEYGPLYSELDPRWIADVFQGLGPTVKGSAAPPRASGTRRIRCPHCHGPIQLLDDRSEEVLCPGCGSTFRLREAMTTSSTTVQSLGKFQLLERVGLGAFGAVWRARDTELDRIVALKIPHAGQAMAPEELRGFLDEARKAARLRHPSIVTVHEVVTLQGMPAIVSSFSDGIPLKDLLEVRRPTFRETARLMAELAEALHYAHVQGLVHRDMKPANIMVENPPAGTPDGEPTVGRPLILDFGLALREEAVVTLTFDGQIIGTPAYMSPEQAAGKGHLADRRSDVFSLGVILFEMLCGELPFRGSRIMMLNQVQHKEPLAPRWINDKIPRDLETICLKTLAKEPDRRYQTAAALAEDLRRFLAGQPIHARPAGRVGRVLRWCRRHPRDAIFAGFLLTLLLLLAVGGTTAAFWIDHLRRTADGQRQRAEDHFAKTLTAVDLLTQAAREVLEEVPQMEKRQEEMLERAQGFLNDLVSDRPADRKTRQNLALVNHRMGDILKRLGNYPAARQSYLKAIEEFQRLEKEVPDPEHRHCLGICYNDLAEVLRATTPGEAEPWYRKALALQRSLVKEWPGRPAYRQELARTCNNFGLFFKNSGPPGFGTAKEMLDEANRLQRDLEKEDPRQPAYQADLARSYINRGLLFSEKQGGPGQSESQKAQAHQDYHQAIVRLENLPEPARARHDYQYKLAVAHYNLAELLRGDLKGATPALGTGASFSFTSRADQEYETAAHLLGNLVDRFRHFHLYKKELAQTLNGWGTYLAIRGQNGQAKEKWETARTLFEQLAEKPGLPGYKSLAAQTWHNLGLLAKKQGKKQDALRFVERAIFLQNEALQSDPGNPEFKKRLQSHKRLYRSLKEQNP